jgi:hypothetical protein
VSQTRAQKLRAQKAIERASVVADQIGVKIQRSEGHAKVIKERSKEWDNVNTGSGRRKGFEVLGDLADDEGNTADAEDIVLEVPKKFGDGDVPLDHEEEGPEESVVLPLRTVGSVETPDIFVGQTLTMEPRPQDIPLPALDDVPDI